MSGLTFTCTHCGEAFWTSDALTAHVAKRHGSAGQNGRPATRLDGWVPPVAAAPPAPARPLARPAGESSQVLVRAVWSPMTLLACAGLVAGAVTVSVAYNWAATHQPGRLQYVLFWAGEFIFLIPAIIRLLNRHATRAERLGLLAMIGLFAYLPKLLRDPSGPLFADELSHWHQTQAMFASGKIFVPNSTLPIIEYFPGLHLLTVELRHLTGLSTFLTGSILLALLHVVSLVGVFLIVERLTRSSWVAGIAALIYSLNPSFMFFDAQFSYESLSIVFFVWVIACVVGVQTRSRPSERGAWLTIGLVLGAGCIVTHHLATYILVSVLVLIAVVTAARNAASRKELLLIRNESRQRFRLSKRDRRLRLRLTWVFLILLIGGAAAWAALVATGIVAYLSPAVVGAVHQAAALVQQESHSRQLFAHTTLPTYERVAAFLTPVALALGALGGLRLLWRSRRQAPPVWLALGLFGLVYFAAVPVMLTAAGSEGARRTWAYSYLGLSLLIAPFLAVVLAKAGGRLRRGSLVALIVVLLGAVLVGNVSIQVDPEYRFPGPYVYGSDTRSLTPELLGMTKWFRTTLGADQRVVADRDSTLALANFGDAHTAFASAGFPVWELYFWPGLPEPRLVKDLSTSGFRYLVIDRRMSQNLPLIGAYFGPDEPEAARRTAPPPAAALSKYETLPWVTKIYTSNNLEIYQFDFGDYAAHPVVSALTSGGLP